MPALLWWWCCWFSDVLGSAFSLLQSSFVAQLLDMLPVSMDPRAALARNPDQWRVQEAVFVCLQAVSREAGDLLNTGAPEVRMSKNEPAQVGVGFFSLPLGKTIVTPDLIKFLSLAFGF